jgi:cellulose synthase/poly-beta-1,6-N-acetylglucosamine synthase-like glycosyltransferase
VYRNLTQSLVHPESKLLKSEFSIGICAADHATNLRKLLDVIEHETYPEALLLKKVIVVASGCEPTALNFLNESEKRRYNFILIDEPERRGKSEAINQIIDSFDGEFLVLVNSDAMPERGAISKLLDVIMQNRDLGVVSASPVLGRRSGITGAVLRLLWGVHNECLLTLNVNDQNNHCCDELVVVRSSALHKLPNGTVNDGAFLAGAAYRSGYKIRFCEEAKVRIDVPVRLGELMQQRRRIVYGHLQILRTVGQAPRTVESLLTDNPRLGLSILIKTIARSPTLILALPIAVIGETISVTLAVLDSLTSSTKHAKWDRVGSRA